MKQPDTSKKRPFLLVELIALSGVRPEPTRLVLAKSKTRQLLKFWVRAARKPKRRVYITIFYRTGSPVGDRYLYTRLHRRPPAETDMQEYFRVSPPPVHQMVLTLERAGFIRRQTRPPAASNYSLIHPTAGAYSDPRLNRSKSPCRATSRVENDDVLKLHIACMALQTDVARAKAQIVGRDRIVCDKLTVERDLDEGVGGLDFKGIPLTSRFGRNLGGRRQGIDGTRLV